MSFTSFNPVRANRGRKSKKIPGKINRHICLWCGGRIEFGASCYSWAGVWEGDFGSGYFHVECKHAFDFVARLPEYRSEGVEFDCDWARGRADNNRSELAEFSSTLPPKQTRELAGDGGTV